MVTCKDCFNAELCTKWAITYDETPLWDKPIECDFFKDKSQYAEVKHGEWELYADNEDGYNHHRCSVCKADAIFTYIEEPNYDEGLDGEWHYICDIEVGIEETLTDYCPHCGVNMNGGNNGNL